MKIRTTITAVAAPAALAAILLGTAGQAAQASTLAAHPAHPVEAITKIVNRADNGGGGQWANDSFTRTADVFYLGKVSPAQIAANPALATTPFTYWAQVKDAGTFRNLPGQLAPNQGGRYAGVHMKAGQVSGPMTGTGQWGLFYASAKAQHGLAPGALKGNAVNALYPSSTWPELLFPAGTTFAGVTESGYDYAYQAAPFTKWVVKTVNGKPALVKISGFHQRWEDASFNGDGQAQRDGQILGVR
jgi:hypothetical protein